MRLFFAFLGLLASCKSISNKSGENVNSSLQSIQYGDSYASLRDLFGKASYLPVQQAIIRDNSLWECREFRAGIKGPMKTQDRYMVDSNRVVSKNGFLMGGANPNGAESKDKRSHRLGWLDGDLVELADTDGKFLEPSDISNYANQVGFFITIRSWSNAGGPSNLVYERACRSSHCLAKSNFSAVSPEVVPGMVADLYGECTKI